VNYIEWQDHVLGNNRTFNTYTGTLIATSAAGPANFSTNVLASWQYTQEKLLPGDQIFTIGGPTTVRGYPTNAASGDSGYYFNAELHYNWSQWLRGFDTYIFTDWGAVYSTFPGVTEMASVGVGFSWTYAQFMTFEANYATPLKNAGRRLFPSPAENRLPTPKSLKSWKDWSRVENTFTSARTRFSSSAISTNSSRRANSYFPFISMVSKKPMTTRFAVTASFKPRFPRFAKRKNLDST